ncbi:MAG: RND transporter, partial [Chitinophagales bacterium]
VKVTINKSKESKTQVLPKSCVLSDEMMKEFWVMQMINDSTAIKIPVVVGNKNTEQVEILSPQFSTTDQIINKGNYGLPDTAFVTITTTSEK